MAQREMPTVSGAQTEDEEADQHPGATCGGERVSFWLAEPSNHSGSTNVWLTPRWVLDLFGPFALDPCGAPNWKTAHIHFYEEENGLYQPWSGFVWCNPPYGKNTGDWVQRWVQHGNGLLLVANRSDTSWWQMAARGSLSAWFPKGRISFVSSDGVETKGTAFASILFAAGEEAAKRLERAKHLGTILYTREAP